jgi:hypothetical protein
LGLEIVWAGALPEGGYGPREDPTFSCGATCHGATRLRRTVTCGGSALPLPLPGSPLEQQSLVHWPELTPHSTLDHPLSVEAGIDVRTVLNLAEEL